MPESRSIFSYRDCEKLCQRALEAEKGIKYTCNTYAEAVRLRYRIYIFRRMDRQRNTKLYPDTGHHLHGNSVFDGLHFEMDEKFPDGTRKPVELRGPWLKLIKSESHLNMGAVENLEDD